MNAPISLSKISLDKKGESISLEKKGAGFGDVRVNLNWNQGGASSGGARPAGMLQRLFSGKPVFAAAPSIDLDLGCLFEMVDGTKGAVQALGGGMGSYQGFPYVELSGDDRTGQSADGETLRINGEKFAKIKRLLIYAFIYEGAANWDATDGVVTVEVPGERTIEVRMTGGRNDRSMCGICVIENVGGRMRVTQELDYHAGHRALDEAHRWGLRWKQGSKD